MTAYRQLKGSNSQLVIDYEDTFGELNDSGSRKGWILPFVKNSIASSRKLKASNIIRGSNNPSSPDEDNLDVSGSVEVPLDAHSFGQILRGCYGQPTTVAVPTLALSAGAAVNVATGKVGIPCVGHGLAVGAPVILSGTTHYDGAYTLLNETSADQLVVAASYTAETFTTSETCTVARRISLSGSATDLGSGTVGLPCKAHGVPVGARLVIAGSTNYDGTFEVLRGTTADVLHITASYEAETFAALAVTVPFFDHTFLVADQLPSFTAVKGWPSRPLYFLARGCKFGKLPIKGGGSGEITTSIDVTGAGEDKGTTAYASSLVTYPLDKFLQRHLTLTIGGSLTTKRVTELELDVDFALDADTYTINDPATAGERGDINELTLGISGTLKALFKDTTFVDLALDGTTTSLAMLLNNKGYQLEFSMAEMRLERTTPPVDGPKGVVESYTFQAWYDTASVASAIVTRLRNEIYNWEA